MYIRELVICMEIDEEGNMSVAECKKRDTTCKQKGPLYLPGYRESSSQEEVNKLWGQTTKEAFTSDVPFVKSRPDGLDDL